MTDITRAFKTGSGLGSIGDEALRRVLGTRTLDDCGLDIDDGNTENVETNADVDYMIDGVMYTYATDAEIDLSGEPVIDADGDTVSATVLATGYTRVYLLVIDASGNIAVVEGEDVANGEDVFCPGAPDGWCPFGAVKVVNATGSDFTFGTTGLDTSGITDTYYSLGVVPSGAL